MTLPLQDQVAFITGAGSGLGAETARRLAKDGAIIAVNDLNETAAQSIANEVGGIALPFDVVDSHAFDLAVDSCVSQLGRIDMQPQRSGRIINMSSVLGLYPSSGAPHYSVAKAAIITLTKTVAEEVAGLGINVNAICPGYIDTPLLTPFSEVMKAGITMRIGKGHMGEASDIAEMVRFLVGPESRYCTGDVFAVSGGYR